MNLQEIKESISNGKKVYWIHEGYEVIKDKNAEYLVVCLSNGYTIGLTWKDGITMNGQENDFFIKEKTT